jgi:hypothetical protein
VQQPFVSGMLSGGTGSPTYRPKSPEFYDVLTVRHTHMARHTLYSSRDTSIIVWDTRDNGRGGVRGVKGGGCVVKNGRFSCFSDPFPSIPFIPSVQTSPGDTSSTTIASMHRLVGLPWPGGEGGAKQCRSIGIDRISFFTVFSLVLRSTIDSRRLVWLFVFSVLCSM